MTAGAWALRSAIWYVNRLRVMSAQEIALRIGRAVTGAANRIGLLTAAAPVRPERANGTVWLGDSSAQHINHGIVDVAASADRVLTGSVGVFALDRQEPAERRNWNRDPLTGTIAPMGFGPAVDVHSQGVVGNIKYLWEPNRHLELPVLALAWRQTGDDKYLTGISRLLESWFDQCPYLKGPNWNSGLELSIRLINWSIAWQLLETCGAAVLDDGSERSLRARWLDSIYQHMHFVHGHYSRHSSANNHLIGEAAGVYIASRTWPFWDKAKKWGDTAQSILVEEVGRQTHTDGVNREQAISYQQFVLDFFILSGLAGRATGNDFPSVYWAND